VYGLLERRKKMAVENVLATQITAGAIIAFVVQKLKASPYFPWITEETKVLKNLLALVLAGAAAVGVNVAWNGADHTLVISGLTASGILLAAWAWAKQYVMQHLAGQVMYPSKKEEVPPKA
jgi:hypothetical protein